eukprot:CAMPEP_0115006850 /NCGR_PEP_ID=MMETSP0216-20121206/20765_1 /TAXON_ID=223996 /ORGANISM="Protocruzia adherens, Strain Boccale" /LENGTH=552 /DNA_ID=CAMNT_0002373551 /DNA_START=550 /DNA_END=2208 /DNA_ORIENTATION=-
MQQQQVQRSMPQQRLVGRNIGNRRNMARASVPYNSSIADGDDEPIEVTAGETWNEETKIDVKSLQYAANEFLELNLRAGKKKIDPKKKEQIIPCLASIKAKEISTESNRAPLDLICVIDKSGSMMGEKMSLVKDTFDFLIDELSDNDRLSLIEFESHSNRLTPLKRMTETGRKEAKDAVESIQATGGTNIGAAMGVAFETIKKRKYANKVTSILLLSDGIDGQAHLAVQQVLTKIGITDDFSVNTFGYGSDHDPEIMGNIAEMKDGVFHFIEKLDDVSDAFADCIGGLMSVIAKDVQITVKPELSEKLPNLQISKVYMDQTNLKENRSANPRTFTVTYSQILSGSSKDFVFMLKITNPDGTDVEEEKMDVIAEEDEENKNDRELVPDAAPLGDEAMVASATCQYVPLNCEEPVTIHKDLSVVCGNVGAGVPTDQEVMINYFRVKTAEVLKNADVLAADNALERARALLNEHLAEMEGSSLKSHERITVLITDTRSGLGRMQDRTTYSHSGKAYFKSMARNHMMQHSSVSNECYSNRIQATMVKKSKARKGGY